MRHFKLISLLLLTVSFAHADEVLDAVHNGAVYYDQLDQIFSVESTSCSEKNPSPKNCTPADLDGLKTVKELRGKIQALVPTSKSLRLNDDKSKLSHDDLVQVAMWDQSQVDLIDASLKTCKGSTCVWTRKGLQDAQATAASDIAMLEKSNRSVSSPAPAVAESNSASGKRDARTLDDLKGLQITQDQIGSLDYQNYKSNNEHPEQGHASFSNPTCTFDISGLTTFDNYSKDVYMSKKSATWQVGAYTTPKPIKPGSSDGPRSSSITLCQSLREDLREQCTNTIVKGDTFQPPSYVAMTDGEGKTLTITSNADDPKKDIFNCLHNEAFNMPQVAADKQIATDDNKSQTTGGHANR